MLFLAAPSSLTPESPLPALEHYLGSGAGFTIFERLATLNLLNEARLGSLALRLGHLLGWALAGKITPARHQLRYMFNVQFTWQSPFILRVHSVFHDAPKITKGRRKKMILALSTFIRFYPA